MLRYIVFYFKNICSIALPMSGAPNLQTTLNICKDGIFFVIICTIVACGARVRPVFMCPIVTSCDDAAALPSTIPVQITTATASPGLSLAATSVIIILSTSIVAVIFSSVTSVVTAPVPVVILISSVMSTVIYIALFVTFVTVKARLHVEHVVKHGLHH